MVDALSANNKVTVLYFYCHDPQYHGHGSILRSLLKQLYILTDAKSIVEEFWERHKSDTPCDGDGETVTMYLNLFVEILSTPTTYIILAGADRCKHDGLDNIFAAWSHIRARSDKVIKIFISSTDGGEIQKRLHQERQKNARDFGEMSLQTMPGHLDDLNEYVRDQAQSVAKEWGMWQGSSQELVKNASAMLFESASGR